jgi:hypothetical protein
MGVFGDMDIGRKILIFLVSIIPAFIAGCGVLTGCRVRDIRSLS